MAIQADPGPAERKKTRNDARRAEIVDIAATLFAKRGYAETGIAEIGDTVGLARGALYYYIGSKESLLAEIHDRVLVPLLEETHRIVDLEESPEARLRRVSLVLLEQIIERRDHVWVFLHEYRALTGARRDKFRAQRREFEALLAQLFREGVEDGTLMVDDEYSTVIGFLGLHNYTYQVVRSNPKLQAGELSQVYCDIFFNGISARRRS
jgi:TetR/AcrR family transcriptional regulator, cholesterol catabolism regulator